MSHIGVSYKGRGEYILEDSHFSETFKANGGYMESLYPIVFAIYERRKYPLVRVTAEIITTFIQSYHKPSVWEYILMLERTMNRTLSPAEKFCIDRNVQIIFERK